MESGAITALGAIGLAVAVTNMLARRFGLPPVLIFLVMGALAGPSVFNLVNQDEVGPFFELSIEVLVGLIVFEGAFSIDVGYLRRVGGVVRNLLTFGLIATFVAGTVLAGATDLLPWRTAMVFGALVTVTGPTVIAPLVRRVRLNDHVRAVLLGEGVLIDPLGAILAIVVIDVALSGLDADPFVFVPTTLAGGTAIGIAGAAAVRGVLWINREPPVRDVTLLLLGMSIATFALAAELVHDSELVAMAVMGVVLAGVGVPHAEDVREFEDDLSQLLIGAIYVLAAATVDLDLLQELWPTGFLVVLLLMVLVRPAVVWLSSVGSDLDWRERLYIGLIGPRGVVAAALAAFAGERLGADLGGPTLTALVFLTVFITVAVQSTYAGYLAGLLQVRAMRAVIAGSGALGRRLAQQLTVGGFDIVLVDVDEEAVERARAEGLNAELGDATEVRMVESLDLRNASIAVGATDSDQSNLLFCQVALSANEEAQAFARVSQPGAVDAFEQSGIRTISEVETLAQGMLDLIGAPVLHDALLPSAGGRMTVEVPIGTGLNGRRIAELGLPARVLVLLVRRGGEDIIPDGATRLQRGDRILLFGHADLVPGARERLVAVE